jgi:hypothetical protein
MGEEEFDEHMILADDGARLVVRGGYGRHEVFFGFVPTQRTRDLFLRMSSALLAARSALHHGDACPSRGQRRAEPCNCGAGPVMADISAALSWPPERAWRDEECPLVGLTLDETALADLHETVRLMQQRGKFRWPATFRNFRRSTR